MTNAAAGGNTVLGTGGGAVAGITAQAFYVYTPNISVQELAVDDTGNVGAAASYYSASRRELKTHITKLPFDPLALVDKIHILSWCLKTDPKCLSGAASKNLGGMANGKNALPVEILDGPQRRSVSVNNEAALALAAIQELEREVRELARRRGK
jgi:hypothetical protein